MGKSYPHAEAHVKEIDMSEIITCIHSDADSVFTFTEFNSFESNGLTNCSVAFVPAITINCKPPFVKGKVTSSWIKFRPGNKPTNKIELEGCLGMSIERWE